MPAILSATGIQPNTKIKDLCDSEMDKIPASSIATAKAQIDGGKARAIAVTGPAPAPKLPNAQQADQWAKVIKAGNIKAE